MGYGSIWTFDHLLPFSGDIGGPCFETLTTLAPSPCGRRAAPGSGLS